MPRTDGVDGKVVLITGAAQGVGAATARALIDRGASVSLVDIAEAPLAALREQLGPRALASVADITDYDAMAAAAAATVDHFGGIDAVIANAGIEILDWTAQMPPEDFRRVVDVNLVGTWNTIRATLDAVTRRRGYYLVVSSLSAVTHGPMNAAYNAAKAGAVAVAQSVRLEVRSDGVAVGVAYLTYTDTPTARRAVEDPRMHAILERTRGPSLRPMPVDAVARRYVRAIERRERRVLFDRSSRIAVAMPQLAQALLERLMGPAVAAARRSGQPPHGTSEARARSVRGRDRNE
jgi:NAD(P)-dependent dehydrogenase (short-subunit alcohol dehydrogenase family)